MTIQSYKFIIASLDEFNSIEKLLKAYNEGTLGARATVFSYEAPAVEIDAAKETNAVLIGYGMAFESGWCMNNTITHLIKG